MDKRFAISRQDGRSNAQVLIDYVKAGEAGRVFSYEELQAELSAGTDREFSVGDVQGVVVEAGRRLLSEHCIALDNIRNTGYRIAPAADHSRLALTRTRKADLQIKRGMSLLKNVRWDEMDANARTAHEGMLLVMSSFHGQQQAFDKRLRSLERAFAKVGIAME